MKYLFLIAHADFHATSTSHQLAEACRKAAIAAGHEVRVVDLVKEGFDKTSTPEDFINVPEGRFSYGALQKPENLCKVIKDQQANCEWCEAIVVFAPIWFYTLPSCFHSYMQRVFTVGWGYNFEIPREKLVNYGKHYMMVTTAGGPASEYQHLSNFTSTEGMLYPISYCFNGCGFTCHRTFPLYSKPYTPVDMEDKIVDAVLNIEKRQLLPFGEKHEGKDMIEVFAALNDIDY